MRKTVLLHPGFHKTGTTTLQRGLWGRRRALRGQLDMLILKDIRPVSLCARTCSTDPTPGKLTNLAAAMASVLASRDVADPRPLFISSEALAGQIPGRNGFQSYAQAPAMLEKVVDAIHRHYRNQADIRVWFTTRDPESWRRSVYFQNVRTVRVTEGFESFGAKLAQAPHLDQIVCCVRARLAGKAQVVSSSLEGGEAHALGLMGEVFDLLGVVSQDASPPIHQNLQDGDLMAALLKLNRSALCDADVSAAKNDLLTWHRKRCQQLTAQSQRTLTPEIQDPWALAARSPDHLSDGPYR